MALVKTYLLAPSFNFRPDGPIALGNIIADPFRPHRVLTKADPGTAQPEIETVFEDDFVTHRSAGQGVSVSVWAQFLANVGINLGTNFSKETSTEYNMSSLKTIYFKSEPSEQELHKRVNVPRVRNVLQSGRVRSCPVYMISGIKIAENLEIATERGVHKGISAGASAPVVEGVSLGGNVELTRDKSQRDSSRARQDVVFAYQLLEIRLKGWKEKSLETREFRSKAAFLGDKEEKEPEIEVEAADATAAGLSALDRKDISPKAVEVSNGEETCVCISFPDEQSW
ncbi:Carbohydrate-binding-like protein [Lasiodiplodia theobromae]|uniref:Carbohydrate-binding-like protein n=1 Tax=Lasiodiplodia theobromae TaxID=45133 RepID=UPI0015C3E3D2|nr:Carbohydrate-binding-like protein [Lasiodiplodia theobromae]KAF4544495.1 Carbohydrate-binding-like protein [Lasiodiplodia theobromae]